MRGTIDLDAPAVLAGKAVREAAVALKRPFVLQPSCQLLGHAPLGSITTMIFVHLQIVPTAAQPFSSLATKVDM